ncbi:M43 family zinc metalloprotease [uncultured Flavobacterium sp.]|uniref:M43 family zinc metalloprotease n=1 Tax=uncultured Flavobacterium sp. TaxID=165435 RepID=UPI0011F6BAB8|nr:M43 family zinc metalloprotease [uncultured Flavobacterium sp.]THD33226.1 MAG: T9SS type A sorting domain-containing protein [Flavobacterium johnsoniae]
MNKFICGIICFLLSYVGFAQQQKEIKINQCGTDELINQTLKKNPQLQEVMEMNEKMVREVKADKISQRSGSQSLITIPVIVYVVHDGTSTTNISDDQVQSQISALNNYFNPYAMKFCLATKTVTSSSVPMPSGAVQTTPGIIHVSNSTLSNHAMTVTSQMQLENATSGIFNSGISSDTFLRIWVVKSIDGTSSNILGYGTFPGMPMGIDGIVVRYDAFGDANTCSNCNLLPGYDQGKVLVHEVGHHFGLYHTFENGCSGNTPATCETSGDRVCDTPQVAVPNSGCPVTVNSCLGESPTELPDLINNHMDYTNDICRNEFTQGQKERMFAMLSIHRNSLYTAENLINSGVTCTPSLISANFTASSYTACIGSANAITFTAVNAPGVSYSWNFGDSGSPSNTANTQIATHTFSSTANSPYTVTLTVTRIFDGITTSSTAQIFVENCSPILNSDSNWYTSWSNMLKFHTGTPSFDLSFPETAPTSYALTTQSDNSGNLLFYAGKDYVWNANYQQLNTQSMAPDSNGARVNSVISLPNPGSASKYTIFTNNSNSYNDQGFRYHIVNATSTALATLGPIRQPVTIPSNQGFLTSPIDGALIGGEGVTAIKKCSGDDYWIITGLKKNNGYFLVVYSFTNTPINGGLTYVSQFQINPYNLDYNSIEASPNGDKLFLFLNGGSTKSFIYDFNKISGTISNEKEITVRSSVVGAAFSPDSKLLYIIDYQRVINQYNLSSPNINNTKIDVYRLPSEKFFHSMQSGPDGKIYMNIYPSKQLAVIHSPNTRSTSGNPNACNFSTNGPLRPGGNYASLGGGLPNMIDAKHATVYPGTPASISSYITACNTYKFFPDFCGTSFSWDFGDPASGSNNTSTEANPTHVFSAGSLPLYTYTVKLKNSSNVVIAQTTITIQNDPIQISGSTEACVATSPVTNNYTTLQEGDNAIWSITQGTGTFTGPNNLSNFNVNWTSLPGTITLTITNSAGCIKTITQNIASSCIGEGTDKVVFTTKLQSDNKIIMGGNFTSYNGIPINRIARLNTNMSLDTTFQVGTGANDVVYCSAIQTDGKIVIGGEFTNYNGNLRNGLVRLNNDGSIDTSFTIGTGINNPSPGLNSIKAMAIQSDGKIIIGGLFTSYNGTARVNLARLNANGTLDNTFVSNFISDGNTVECIEIQNDGKIIVGGYFTSYGSDQRSGIIRLNSNGTIDTTFNPGTGIDWGGIHTVKALPDGKIIAGGDFGSYNGNLKPYLVKLNSNGSIDTSFSPSSIGIRPGGIGVMTIGIQTDGKIIIGGGFSIVDNQIKPRIARLNSSGSLDLTFNPGSGFGPVDGNRVIGAKLYSLSIQPDGKIVCGGYFKSYNSIEVNNITRIDLVTNIIGRTMNQNVVKQNETDTVEKIYTTHLHEITLYPNPTNGILNIGVSDSSKTPDSYTIYNSLGQAVKQIKNVTEESLKIDTSNYATGIYVIRFTKGNETKTLQFVKN